MSPQAHFSGPTEIYTRAREYSSAALCWHPSPLRARLASPITTLDPRDKRWAGDGMHRRWQTDRDGGGELELIVAVAEVNSGIAQVLSAIAQLLWPIVALILAYRLLPELKLIFHKISESKNLKVKWGDKELSVQEAADNIQKVVGSLIDAEGARSSGRASVSTPPTPLSGASGTTRPDSVMPPDAGLAEVARIAAAGLRRVLWVDDTPNSIALEMARLKDWNVRIDEAHSTEEALEQFQPGKYSLVITDMYRREQGVRNTDAGIDLLKEPKSIDPRVIVIAYCASSSARQYGSLFLESGGTAVTSSAVELFEHLSQYLPRE